MFEDSRGLGMLDVAKDPGGASEPMSGQGPNGCEREGACSGSSSSQVQNSIM